MRSRIIAAFRSSYLFSTTTTQKKPFYNTQAPKRDYKKSLQLYNTNFIYDSHNVISKFAFSSPNYYFMQSSRLILKTKKAFSIRCIQKDQQYVKGSSYGTFDFGLAELNRFVNTRFQEGEVFDVQREKQSLKVWMHEKQESKIVEKAVEINNQQTKVSKAQQPEINIQPIQTFFKPQISQQDILKKNAETAELQLAQEIAQKIAQKMQQSNRQNLQKVEPKKPISSLHRVFQSIHNNRVKVTFSTQSSNLTSQIQSKTPKTSQNPSQNNQTLKFHMKTQKKQYRFQLTIQQFQTLKNTIQQSIPSLYGLQFQYEIKLNQLVEDFIRGDILQQEDQFDSRFSL